MFADMGGALPPITQVVVGILDGDAAYPTAGDVGLRLDGTAGLVLEELERRGIDLFGEGILGGIAVGWGLVQLVTRSLCAESVGYSVLYGISDNRERFFNNDKARHIGYVPKDSAEAYREKVEAKCPPGDPADPAVHFVGGVFCNYGHPDDEG